MTTTIKIKGGDYEWTDTKDGYKIVHDVPLISEWKKGDHGAPYDGTKEVLDEFVATAQKRYQDGAFCATAYVGHNPEIQITHPDFAGYVLPNRVGPYKLEQGEKQTVFGDIKLDSAKFESARAGKLPYLSVEVPWPKRRIRGLAFLDTVPPQYEYALFTVGKERKDAVAKFEAKGDPESLPHTEADEEAEFAKAYPKTHKLIKGLADTVGKMAARPHVDPMIQKPDPLPAEPGAKPKTEEAKMTADEAAKFAALVDKSAQFEAKFAAMENEKKAALLMAKAEKTLAANILSQPLRQQLGEFAAEAVVREKGDEWFDKIIERLKPTLKTKPTASLGADLVAADASISDPLVAKFAKEDPDCQEEIAQFAAQWEQWEGWQKGSVGSKDDYIKNELALAKAKRSGAVQDQRR